MTLEALIEECIATKTDDKQFALFYLGSINSWRAMIGNSGSSVSLGESEGEFVAEGSTALEAVQRLRELIG